MQLKPSLLSFQPFQDCDVLARARQLKCDLLCGSRHSLCPLQNPLGEWVTDAIGVCVFNVFPHSVGAGVDDLALEWIRSKREFVTGGCEVRVVSQIVASDLPETVIKPIKDAFRVDPDTLDNLLVEIG